MGGFGCTVTGSSGLKHPSAEPNPTVVDFGFVGFGLAEVNRRVRWVGAGSEQGENKKIQEKQEEIVEVFFSLQGEYVLEFSNPSKLIFCCCYY